MAFKTADGTWRVTVRFGGRRVSKNFRTAEQARHFEAKVRLAKEAPTAPASKVSFGNFADRWLLEYSAVEKAESSRIEDKWAVERYLKPLWAKRRLSTLEADDMTALKVSLKARINAETLSTKSANNILGIAKKIVRTAKQWKVIPVYPWDGVSKFKLVEQKFRYWTVGEVSRFVEAARFRRPEIADMVLFAANTGMRLGEIRGLTWDAVNLDHRMIEVGATYDTKLRKRFERTKNGRIGHVPMNDQVVRLLARRAKSSEFVFDRSAMADPYACFTRLQATLGLKPIRFHDLRHSFASNLVAAGVDLYTVQRLMRHSTIAMTERYAHLAPEHLASAVARIDVTDPSPMTALETLSVEKQEGKLVPSVGLEPKSVNF